jgi:hypothetical protein
MEIDGRDSLFSFFSHGLTGTWTVAFDVLCDLVGGKNSSIKSWMKILAEPLAPLLLGIDW